nr:MAG TPA: hypothetical protein [Caudoviricetes sp.]
MKVHKFITYRSLFWASMPTFSPKKFRKIVPISRWPNRSLRF